MLSGCWSPRTVAHGAIRVVRRWPCRRLLAVGLCGSQLGQRPQTETLRHDRDQMQEGCVTIRKPFGLPRWWAGWGLRKVMVEKCVEMQRSRSLGGWAPAEWDDEPQKVAETSRNRNSVGAVATTARSARCRCLFPLASGNRRNYGPLPRRCLANPAVSVMVDEATPGHQTGMARGAGWEMQTTRSRDQCGSRGGEEEERGLGILVFSATLERNGGARAQGTRVTG